MGPGLGLRSGPSHFLPTAVPSSHPPHRHLDMSPSNTPGPGATEKGAGGGTSVRSDSRPNPTCLCAEGSLAFGLSCERASPIRGHGTDRWLGACWETATVPSGSKASVLLRPRLEVPQGSDYLASQPIHLRALTPSEIPAVEDQGTPTASSPVGPGRRIPSGLPS